jgi:hypothetical protein
MAQSRAFVVYQNFLRQLSANEKPRLVKQMSEIKPVPVGNGDVSFVKAFEQLAARISQQKGIELSVQCLSMFYFSEKLGVKPSEADFSENNAAVSGEDPSECCSCTIA